MTMEGSSGSLASIRIARIARAEDDVGLAVGLIDVARTALREIARHPEDAWRADPDLGLPEHDLLRGLLPELARRLCERDGSGIRMHLTSAEREAGHSLRGMSDRDLGSVTLDRLMDSRFRKIAPGLRAMMPGFTGGLLAVEILAQPQGPRHLLSISVDRLMRLSPALRIPAMSRPLRAECRPSDAGDPDGPMPDPC